MLSSVDLQLERLLIFSVLIIFFGVGFSGMLITFIINAVRKKQKNGLYYLLSFVIFGIIGLALATFYFYMILIK
ncbi:hypothetical protein CW752_01510 [Chryseobacterium sp. PMSZPI]|nr:hypothetical protein CW752_01510 [Chryseobacterium sp. PMSZPI]